MVSARMARAFSKASSGVCASWTPPALPRPPTSTCALITTGPPSEVATSRASSAVVATWPGSTGNPARANSSLAWYSCRFMSAPSVVVDLGPLDAAAEVHVDALPLGEGVEHGVSRLAVAVAGPARPAERQVRLGPGRAVIDVDDSGFEIAHRLEGAMHVTGEDRGRQSVARSIVQRDRVLEAAHLHHRQHRTEDLLDGDPRVAGDAAEDRGPEEMPARERRLGGDRASGNQRALALADLDVAAHRLDLRLIDQRSDLGGRIEAVTETQRLGLGGDPFDQGVVDALVDQHPAARRAALASGAKRAPRDRVG